MASRRAVNVHTAHGLQSLSRSFIAPCISLVESNVCICFVYSRFALYLSSYHLSVVLWLGSVFRQSMPQMVDLHYQDACRIRILMEIACCRWQCVRTRTQPQSVTAASHQDCMAGSTCNLCANVRLHTAVAMRRVCLFGVVWENETLLSPRIALDSTNDD